MGYGSIAVGHEEKESRVPKPITSPLPQPKRRKPVSNDRIGKGKKKRKRKTVPLLRGKEWKHKRKRIREQRSKVKR